MKKEDYLIQLKAIHDEYLLKFKTLDNEFRDVTDKLDRHFAAELEGRAKKGDVVTDRASRDKILVESVVYRSKQRYRSFDRLVRNPTELPDIGEPPHLVYTGLLLKKDDTPYKTNKKASILHHHADCSICPGQDDEPSADLNP